METTHVGNMTFSLDLAKPLYEQVLNQIRNAIARGEVELGTKLPSVRELAQQLRVNPNTVMRAYQELERDSLIETRRGQGTFITTSEEIVTAIKKGLAQEAVENFISAMSSLGIDLDAAVDLIKEGDWK